MLARFNYQRCFSGQANIKLIRGNLIDAKTEAVVSSANRNLEGSERLRSWWNFAGKLSSDAAIHEKAGPELLKLLRKIPKQKDGYRMSEGSAVLTASGDMNNCSYIIHCVVPMIAPGYSSSQTIFEHELDKLKNAYSEIFALCKKHSIDSVALPAIGCGANGWQVDVAAKIGLHAGQTLGGELSNIEFHFLDNSVLKTWEDIYRELN